MYRKHFAFTRLPFETPAETDELFESSARREAEARLGHLVDLRGIGLLTGEVGSGKTTVCRRLAAGLHPGLYRVHYVSLTTGNVLDMYKAIAWELGLPITHSRATARKTIRDEISRLSVSTITDGAGIVLFDGHWKRSGRQVWLSGDGDALMCPGHPLSGLAG